MFVGDFELIVLGKQAVGATKSKRKPGRPADPELQLRRQEEILDQAARLFAERGFAAADIQELADSLGIGKGTVYRYFPSKKELFLAAADRGMRALRERVQASIADVTDPLETITAAIRAYLAFFDERPEFVELLIQERAVFKDRKKPTYFVHRDANMGPWRELFSSLVAAGRIRDVPVERMIRVVSDLLYGTMFTNFFTGRMGSQEEQADEILDLVFHGLLTDGQRAADATKLIRTPARPMDRAPASQGKRR